MQPKREAFALDRPHGDIRIVSIEHGHVRGVLPAKHRPFRPAVMIQRTVPVEMVCAEVCDDRHRRADLQSVEIGKLKAAQLEHDDIVLANLFDARQQTDTDVAAQPAPPPGTTQNRMRECGRRRFAVASSHGHDLCAVPLPEQIHLTRQRHSRRPGEVEARMISRDGRIDDDQVGATEVLRIVPTQLELHRRNGLQFGERFRQLLGRPCISHGDTGSSRR